MLSAFLVFEGVAHYEAILTLQGMHVTPGVKRLKTESPSLGLDRSAG